MMLARADGDTAALRFRRRSTILLQMHSSQMDSDPTSCQRLHIYLVVLVDDFELSPLVLQFGDLRLQAVY